MASGRGLVSLLAGAAVFFSIDTLRVRASEEENPTPEQGCTFRSDPAEFIQSQSRARGDIYSRVSKLSQLSAQKSAVPADSVPRRNFIDDEIFGKLIRMKIPSAPRSSDYEFVRRIHFDLTGRLPSAEDIRNFVGNTGYNKREELIEKLLYSPEFNDKWTVWFMDLVGMTESPSVNARRPQVEGRNHFHLFIRDRLSNLRPIRDIVFESLTGKGNNYFTENGPANFTVLASAAMGPIQDTYDRMLYLSASSFLGLGHYDCLLCHNGRGHLDSISRWAQRTTRMEAQRMAAHFARTTLAAPAGLRQYEHPLYNSTEVADVARGTYNLNVTFGNRPPRCAPGATINGRACVAPAAGMPATATLTPEYRDGSAPPDDSNWRTFFAGKLVDDPMFARNFANRLWREFFNLGLVEPVDALDPDRLDPANPPPAPWSLQATHPELLEKLAKFLVESNTDLRVFLRLLVQSSAYQLSSQYSGPWNLEYVTLFARHYPRRLDAEEIHDAIVKATGVLPSYTWPIINQNTVARGAILPQSPPVNWAMQLPDINEPRSNVGNGREFMTVFLRGNRDTAQRSQSGSILQQLNLMNDQFVRGRIRVTTSPVLRTISGIADNNVAVEELFTTFLSRPPSAVERDAAVNHLARAKTVPERNTFLEDLAWVCINKVEFLFSY